MMFYPKFMLFLNDYDFNPSLFNGETCHLALTWPSLAWASGRKREAPKDDVPPEPAEPAEPAALPSGSAPEAPPVPPALPAAEVGRSYGSTLWAFWVSWPENPHLFFQDFPTTSIL